MWINPPIGHFSHSSRCCCAEYYRLQFHWSQVKYFFLSSFSFKSSGYWSLGSAPCAPSLFSLSLSVSQYRMPNVICQNITNPIVLIGHHMKTTQWWQKLKTPIPHGQSLVNWSHEQKLKRSYQTENAPGIFWTVQVKETGKKTGTDVSFKLLTNG